MSWYCDRIVVVEDLGLEVEQGIYAMIRRSRIVVVKDLGFAVEQCIYVMTWKRRGTHLYL